VTEVVTLLYITWFTILHMALNCFIAGLRTITFIVVYFITLPCYPHLISYKTKNMSHSTNQRCLTTVAIMTHRQQHVEKPRQVQCARIITKPAPSCSDNRQSFMHEIPPACHGLRLEIVFQQSLLRKKKPSALSEGQ